MPRVVFVTPNLGKRDDVARLLAGIEVGWSRIAAVPPPGLPLERAAAARASIAFAALGEPCFVENTELEIDGEPARRGAEAKELLASTGEAALAARLAGRGCRWNVVIAYARTKEDIATFRGELSGTIDAAPRGESGWGFDRLIVPEGFSRTLAELGDSRYLVNMRHAPYLDLADEIRGVRFGGAFEAHVTVRSAAGERERFRAACDRLGAKCIAIELPAGEHRDQPMTATHHRGELREVQEEVHAIARALIAEGFEVVRTKIEAIGRHPELPEDDASAVAQLGEGCYFEHHAKLELEPGTDRGRLAEICRDHGAHLSKNALSTRTGGREVRFVTLRSGGVGRLTAEKRFDALLAALTEARVPITRRIAEFTAYDSNLGLDRGW